MVKKKYEYDKCTKCGDSKRLTTKSRCKKCEPPQKKYTYNICSKCKKTKNESRSPYCSTCQQEYGRGSFNKVIDRVGMNDFVNRIEGRGGLCTTNEIFVDLIGFYNQLIKTGDGIDNDTIQNQIKFMWKRVKTYSKTVKK